MTVQETIYRFKLKYDKLDTQKKQNLSIPQILLFLNEGQRKVVNRKYGPNNLSKLGFEENQKRIQELTKLIPDTESLVPNVVNNTQYEINLSSLSKPLMYIIRSNSTASKNNCKSQVLFHKEVTHSDLDDALVDEFSTPSFEWRNVPVSYNNNKMVIYSDGTFTIDKVNIDYIMVPPKIDQQGYTNFDGTPSINQDSLLPDYVVDEIIDEAVILAAKSIDDTNLVNLEKDTLANSE